MQSAERIAKHYFELSNQRQLDLIEPLFAKDAVYHSAHTGIYYGVSDIMTMMRAFFAASPKVKWTIESLAMLSDHIVEIDFLFEGRDKHGMASKRRGIETLIIDGDQIKYISIKSHD